MVLRFTRDEFHISVFFWAKNGHVISSIILKSVLFSNLVVYIESILFKPNFKLNAIYMYITKRYFLLEIFAAELNLRKINVSNCPTHLIILKYTDDHDCIFQPISLRKT